MPGGCFKKIHDGADLAESEQNESSQSEFDGRRLSRQQVAGTALPTRAATVQPHKSGGQKRWHPCVKAFQVTRVGLPCRGRSAVLRPRCAIRQCRVFYQGNLH